MSWFRSWNPFRKKQAPPQPLPTAPKAGTAAQPPKQEPEPPAPELPQELADSPLAKGMMAKFYRFWKNPSFIKQLRSLSAHMAKDGVDVKNTEAVKAWLDKNKAGIEKGDFNEPPQEAAKPQTFVKTGPDVGRNDPCPCGSGKKYKKCCQGKAA